VPVFMQTIANSLPSVSEASNHGMQIFDLNLLLTATPNTQFTATAHFNQFGKAHNIFINEDTGYAYVVGSTTGIIDCNEGIHVINLESETVPLFAGCYGDRGYTHDIQCVVYDGPDSTYSDREICFASNEDKLDIIDVTNKSEIELLSSFSYHGSFYVHQGWLTEDRKYFLIDDELDEYVTADNHFTMIVDVSKLDDPVLVEKFEGASPAVDHNQYILGDFTYQANYRAGLEILKLSDLENGKLERIGFFDTYVKDNANEFNGAWSNYPYLPSGVVLLSDIEQGLFIVRPDLTAAPLTDAPTMAPTQEIPGCQSFFQNLINMFDLNFY